MTEVWGGVVGMQLAILIGDDAIRVRCAETKRHEGRCADPGRHVNGKGERNAISSAPWRTVKPHWPI